MDSFSFLPRVYIDNFDVGLIILDNILLFLFFVSLVLLGNKVLEQKCSCHKFNFALLVIWIHIKKDLKVFESKVNLCSIIKN